MTNIIAIPEKMNITEENLTIYQAEERDWNLIFNLLKESNYLSWLHGDENYKDYFIIHDSSKSAICSFGIVRDKEIGIIKHFVIKKTVQGKGLGKYIANNLIPKLGKELNLKKLYLLSDNKGEFRSYRFWKKTNFIELANFNGVDDFYQKYLDEDKRKHPEYEHERVGFYLTLV